MFSSKMLPEHRFFPLFALYISVSLHSPEKTEGVFFTNGRKFLETYSAAGFKTLQSRRFFLVDFFFPACQKKVKGEGFIF